MSILLRFAALAMLFAAPASAAIQPGAEVPPRLCLNLHDIHRSEAIDNQTILFHMRDGKIWRNRLKTVCPMLTVSPYSEKITGGELLCSNQQFIHVALTGDDCALGEFTPVGGRP